MNEHSRREFLQAAAAAAALGGAIALLTRRGGPVQGAEDGPLPAGLQGTDEFGDPFTPYALATGYNNFYELGWGKADPARNAHLLRRLIRETEPWTVTVEGEVARPGTVDVRGLTRRFGEEERTYRLRCVEAWSMVLPWTGFPLSRLLEAAEPLPGARWVQFVSVHAPDALPGQRSRTLEWPYVEGLRLDEAMHPLTFLASGLHGEALPAQNGAPLRLLVPWKYGFKSAKSLTHVVLTRERPPTTWSAAAGREYGFYANVNPEVHHPRWSQASERRLDGGRGGGERRPTLLFNGYGEAVAGLYRGMDLRQNY